MKKIIGGILLFLLLQMSMGALGEQVEEKDAFQNGVSIQITCDMPQNITLPRYQMQAVKHTSKIKNQVKKISAKGLVEVESNAIVTYASGMYTVMCMDGYLPPASFTLDEAEKQLLKIANWENYTPVIQSSMKKIIQEEYRCYMKPADLAPTDELYAENSEYPYSEDISYTWLWQTVNEYPILPYVFSKKEMVDLGAFMATEKQGKIIYSVVPYPLQIKEKKEEVAPSLSAEQAVASVLKKREAFDQKMLMDYQRVLESRYTTCTLHVDKVEAGYYMNGDFVLSPGWLIHIKETFQGENDLNPRDNEGWYIVDFETQSIYFKGGVYE